MSDDPMTQVLAALTRLEDGQKALETRFNEALAALESRLMARMNDINERLQNRMTSLEQDFQNTKGFLVGDAVISGRRWLDLEARVARLERGNGSEQP